MTKDITEKTKKTNRKTVLKLVVNNGRSKLDKYKTGKNNSSPVVLSIRTY